MPMIVERHRYIPEARFRDSFLSRSRGAVWKTHLICRYLTAVGVLLGAASMLRAAGRFRGLPAGMRR